MAGVLDRLGRSRKRPIDQPAQPRGKDLIPLQLQIAKEILAEVFGITISDVEEMIRLRSEERMLWPEGFWLED